MKKRNEKIIYQTYKKFYEKEPNFNKENFMNITIEIQAMAYILNQYGVSIGGNSFCYEYQDLIMPMSMSIQDIIVEKLIGSKDDFDDHSFQFDKFAEETITIVGEAIKYVISNSQNKIEELRKISNILYVKNRIYRLDDDEKISELARCSIKDLKKVEQLMEFIKQEKSKNKYKKYQKTMFYV